MDHVPFLSLKTPQKSRFSVFKDYEKGTLDCNGLNYKTVKLVSLENQVTGIKIP